MCKLFIVFIGLLVANTASGFTTDKIIGHEELMHFAITQANAALEQDGVTAFRYPPADADTRGIDSKNPLVRGNLASDKAEQITEISLGEFYGIPKGEHLGYSGMHMDIHALRNYRWEGTKWIVEDAKTSCLGGHARIQRATATALAAWDTDEARALFFVGHATHTLQDSFSRAHTRRSADERDLVQICTWEASAAGVCEHRNLWKQDFDPNDVIWSNWLFCPYFKRERACLKPGAEASVDVTAGFLVLVAELAATKVDHAAAAARIERFLSTRDESLGSGYFSCSKL